MSATTPTRDIPFGRPYITDQDREAVMRVLNGHILTHGPECKAFETEFAAFVGDGAYCVSLNSCTSALHLAYFVLGIGPGDEVIVTAQSHAATAHAVELVGATSVFVDCEPQTGNITAQAIEKLITPRTKAIGLVHFIGIPCEMDAIMALAQRHNLKVIEDCAIALGARYRGKHVGLFGEMGGVSFYPVKQITTGDGGMFITKNKEFAEKVARVRALGVDRTHQERSIPGLYDVPMLGFNYRMTEMQAAMGRVQLQHLPMLLEKRHINFEALKAALLGVPEISMVDSQAPHMVTSKYCMIVTFKGALAARRNDIIHKLNAAGVGTSIYYPQPIPRLTYYRNKYGYNAEAFPNATAISDHSIALPVGPHLGVEDMQYIADTLKQTIKDIKQA